MAALDPGPLDLRSFAPDSQSAGVLTMLYNGVSNRARGWKSKGSSEVQGGDTRVSRGLPVKRWDGAARISSDWDNLRRDPELWYKNGNCFVHLHERGQSQREPAFKVPFACLLSTRCGPLVERFADRSISEQGTSEHGQVDLYIPAPSTASPPQALQHHIATRNFFAWVCRRSMVGDHLGHALVALVDSMREYRDEDVDNIQDLMDYLDEEGYLDMRNYPNHALAMLHLAENLQSRDLYIDALAHCVGMSERLYKSSEYLRVGVTTRKLIRETRADLDHRLSRAGAMLYSLLEEELSESHLGLSIGARAHMDRFRAFIHGFYMTSLGYFPPPPADPRCSTIFKPDVYRAMRADFEALYEYLVDERYTTADNSSPEANGGLCTLQSVQAFDLRNKFTPLPHPLPLLPAPLERKETRGLTFKPWHTSNNRPQCEGKLRPDQRLVAHAALMKATNRTKVHLLENDFVLGYRQFEQNFILSPTKSDRSEKPGLSQSDARKVRWLFVYAAYQALRDCTEVPAEVKYQEGVDYHLAVTTKNPLPWQAQAQDGLHPSSRFANINTAAAERPSLTLRGRRHSIGAAPLTISLDSTPEAAPKSCGIEIKPDIDYFALTHQDEDSSRQRPKSSGHGLLAPPSRSRSLSRNLSLRRSMSKLRNAGHQHRSAVKEEARAIFSHKHLQPPPSPSKPVYHEIIVTGYGNGTNCATDSDQSTERLNVPQDIKEAPKSPLCLTVPTTLTASRSASTSSSSSYGSLASSPSDSGKSDSTSPTTVGGSPRSSRHSSAKWDNAKMREDLAMNGCSEIPVAVAPQSYDNLTFPTRQRSATRKSIRTMFASDDMLASETSNNAEAPSLPRRSSKRFSSVKAPASSKRWTLIDVVAPLRDRDDDSDSDSDNEVSRRRTMVRRNRRKTLASIDLGNNNNNKPGGDSLDMSDHEWETTVHSAMEVSPPWSWEQYTDLGGLQPASPSK